MKTSGMVGAGTPLRPSPPRRQHRYAVGEVHRTAARWGTQLDATTSTVRSLTPGLLLSPCPVRGIVSGPSQADRHFATPNRGLVTAAPRAFRSATALVLLVGVVASATVSLVLGPAAAAQSAQSAVTKRAEPAARGVGPAVSTVPITQSDTRVAVGAEPDGTAVTLDVTVLAPSDGQRHPAVLLAHGFGGSKDDLIERGRLLATRGYVVAAYTARGFGQSGGRVHLSDPAFEVKDAQLLIDALAARPDVQLDRPGDPRVGVAEPPMGEPWRSCSPASIGASIPLLPPSPGTIWRTPSFRRRCRRPAG